MDKGRLTGVAGTAAVLELRGGTVPRVRGELGSALGHGELGARSHAQAQRLRGVTAAGQHGVEQREDRVESIAAS